MIHEFPHRTYGALPVARVKKGGGASETRCMINNSKQRPLIEINIRGTTTPSCVSGLRFEGSARLPNLFFGSATVSTGEFCPVHVLTSSYILRNVVSY